jgi:hypothetical protein
MVFNVGFTWPVFLMGFLFVYLLGIIHQTETFLLIILLYFFLLVVAGAYRRGAKRRKSSIVFLSLFLFIVALAIAGIARGREEPQGSEFVDDTAFPALRIALTSVFPRFPLLYEVPGYGISFDEKRLGAKPVLFDDQLFTVTGLPGEALYLRTEVFDAYDGSSWELSQAFSIDKYGLHSQELFLKTPVSVPGDVRIEIVTRKFTQIPHTLDTRSIQVKGVVPDPRGSRNIGFNLATPLRIKDSVILYRDKGRARTDELLFEYQKRWYLKLPAEIPDELRVISEMLKEGTTSPEEYLRKVEMYLALNYAYDLMVEEFDDPAGDFVTEFLMSGTRAGYCVQFASSFVILARLNGVPARYATGYLVYLPNDSDTTIVTGLSAHAWPEVWLDGQGWVTWEATPAANIANYTELGEDLWFLFDIRTNNLTSRQLEGLLGRGQILEDSEQTTSTDARDRWSRIVPLLALTATAILLLGVALRYGIPAIRYALQDDEGKFKIIVRSMVRSLIKRGITGPEQTGWIAWTEAVKAMDSYNEDKLESLQDALMRSSYGENLFRSRYLHIAKAVSWDLKRSKSKTKS